GIFADEFFEDSFEAEREGYNYFKSSVPSLVSNDALVVTTPDESTQVTISSVLSSEKYGKWAPKHPENAKLQKLYKQPVEVTVTVLGKGVEPKPDPAAQWERVSGKDRYDTMKAIADEFGADGCETVIVASGKNFPDAMVANGLAGFYNSPVILVGDSYDGTQAQSTIKSLNAKNVIIIGGEAAVDKTVADQMKAEGLNVDRISGATRVETSIAVYNYAVKAGKTWGDTAIVAGGKTFADSLSISPYSYAAHAPILLTNNNGELDSNALATVRNFDKVLIVGGSASVSTKVEQKLNGKSVYRIAGKTRYETSSMVAHWETGLYSGVNVTPSVKLSYQSTAVTSGANFPDALAGGALMGKEKGVLLLVEESKTGRVSMEENIEANAGDIVNARVFGGTAAVSDNMKKDLDGLLEK
ncbi:MAG: cell wall-binding repeat-containing protein, partial [Coriobacteriales bacterium]